MHKLFSTFVLTAFLTGCGADWTVIDMDGDGIPFSEDCNENDAEIGPGMAEIWYDGIDQNCDGNDADQDLDGFVWIGVDAGYDWQAHEAHQAEGDCWDDPGNIPAEFAIVASEGWEQPAASDVNPDAEDVWYDGPDQDCGLNSDFDQDGDGYDTTEYAQQDGTVGDDCVDGSDRDADPLTCDDDPDDGEDPEATSLDELMAELGLEPADINPGANDTWYDGLDQDCSGDTDFDKDEDGYGLCSDCDDEDPDRFPTGATEIWYDCVDDNCDNNDGDQDGDGYVVEGYLALCPDFEGHDLKKFDDCWDDPTNQPEEFTPLGAFDDVPPEEVYPDALDISYDGIDANCDGESDFDADEDGQDSADYPQRDGTWGTDCDDSDNDIYDGAPETCDAIDSDCDGDFNDINSFDCENYYYDGDEDEYGVEPARCYCAPHDDNGWTTQDNTDCDDNDPDDYPGATETIDNNDDEDCDGADLCYVDSDGDGFGDEDGSTVVGDGDLECNEPSAGEADDTDDCDDSDEDTFPGAAPNDSTTACMNDDDGDDYGDDNAPSGVDDGTDCDDTDDGDYPGADETVDNGDDEDCDGGDLCYVDDDGDGYGDDDGSTTTGNGDLDCDDTSSGEADDTDDCRDDNAYAYPGAAPNDSSTQCMEDVDGDDWGDSNAPSFVDDGTDCDDSDSGDYPGAPETVDNGDDEDCDGGDTCYVDDDGDGYGDDDGSTTTGNGDLDCDDSGEADDTDDCDDSEAEDYPGATETVANGDDEDCDGVDTCYVDDDGDGYGDEDGSTVVGDDLDCDDASNGEADNTDDCDDSTSAVSPGVSDTHANGIDDDCDGYESCYDDNDNDDYGSTNTRLSSDLDCNDNKESDVNTDCDDSDDDTFPGAAPNDSTTSCMTDADGDDYGDDSPGSGVTAGTDCDDSTSAVSPADAEVTADGIDNDCDGNEQCYVDDDGDDYGTTSTVSSSNLSCTNSGEAENDDDCDDTDADVNPGETETTANSTDDDCDGNEQCYVDDDGDEYGTTSTVSSSNTSCTDSGEAENDDDCDDTDADVNPGETETTANSTDDDCDGYEQCYVDSDGDDYGSTSTVASSNTSCTNSGEAENDDDCDDGDGDTYPGAAASDSSTACMTDADGDGYGSETAPSGGSAGTDCDDSDGDVNPDGTEVAGNTTDEDCDDSWDCYYDADDDGYGTEDETVIASTDNDCDDTNESTSITDCDDSDDTVSEANTTDGRDDTSTSDGYQVNVDDDCDDVVDEDYAWAGAELVITEVHPYSELSNEKNGEWFEVYNNTADPIYLDGWLIDLESDASGTGSGQSFYVGEDGLSIASGAYAVLCYKEDVLASAGCDYIYGSDQSWENDNGDTYDTDARLANSGDELEIYVGGVTIDALTYSSGGTWPTIDDSGDGISIELSASALDTTSNDDGANWCNTDTTGTTYEYYSGGSGIKEYGTPQAAAGCSP